MLYPQPSPQATPINKPATVTLDPGEKGTVEYTPKNRVSELVLPIIAISKYANCVYEVRTDGDPQYGPAKIPPTDVDDLQVCFLPALRFVDSLTIEVSNLGSATRDIHVQPVGWEEAANGA